MPTISTHVRVFLHIHVMYCTLCVLLLQVIEVAIKVETGFPRTVIKHMSKVCVYFLLSPIQAVYLQFLLSLLFIDRGISPQFISMENRLTSVRDAGKGWKYSMLFGCGFTRLSYQWIKLTFNFKSKAICIQRLFFIKLSYTMYIQYTNKFCKRFI